MLRAMLKKSWKQHPTKQQLNGHLPLIGKPIQIRRTGHALHCWRSKDGLISDVLLGTPSHGRPARIYRQQFFTDIGCGQEDLLESMDDRDEWREREREKERERERENDMMMISTNQK